VLREQTQGLSLREIIELVLEHSGLVEHYKAEREGADRIENLEELVNAAESFVTQEGFGRDAVALPVDELSPVPASQGSILTRPVLDEPSPARAPTRKPARPCRRWPPSSRMRRWSRATTRRRPARTRCSS
jgi:DNA helicase-2/ATP-dependent DNA helicase PcrA